jgi:Ca2+-binding RTX toxin-like protein
MRNLTIALIVALVFALLAGAAVARPAHKIDCKGKFPCVGTPRADTMFGTNSHDKINAKGGNDYVYARDGCCETTTGGHGDDHLLGQGGVDWLRGEEGNDDVYGGKGGDYINGGGGRDYMTGDDANDKINANDGQRDVVACGPGRDRVTADPRDRLYNCEDVVRR